MIERSNLLWRRTLRRRVRSRSGRDRFVVSRQAARNECQDLQVVGESRGCRCFGASPGDSEGVRCLEAREYAPVAYCLRVTVSTDVHRERCQLGKWKATVALRWRDGVAVLRQEHAVAPLNVKAGADILSRGLPVHMSVGSHLIHASANETSR